MRRSSASGPSGVSFAVLLTSAYLLIAGVWLVLTRQIPAPPLRKLLLGSIRPPYAADIVQATYDQGHCWTCSVPGHVLSDVESASRLVLLEDGKPLGPGHSAHDEIRQSGCGRYSHWGEVLYFSTSDNSNPNTNGKRYRVGEDRR